MSALFGVLNTVRFINSLVLKERDNHPYPITKMTTSHLQVSHLNSTLSSVDVRAEQQTVNSGVCIMYAESKI